jgi:hypothetical protein
MINGRSSVVIDSALTSGFVVDLRGRLSNREAREAVGLAARAVAGQAPEDRSPRAPAPADEGATSAPAPGGRPWRVVDRLGEQIIGELLAARRTGMTLRSLAQRYGVSESTVKRLTINAKNVD